MAKNTRKHARRGMPMLAKHVLDLFASRQGRDSSSNVDFGAISRVSGPEILRPRKNFEILGPNHGERHTQTRTPRHADARQTCYGPVGLAARPGVVVQRGLWRNFTRLRSPALTNRPWRPIFTKNRNILCRVRAKARAASVRHCTVYI